MHNSITVSNTAASPRMLCWDWVSCLGVSLILRMPTGQRSQGIYNEECLDSEKAIVAKILSFWHPCQNRCISGIVDEIQLSAIQGTSSTFHILSDNLGWGGAGQIKRSLGIATLLLRYFSLSQVPLWSWSKL